MAKHVGLARASRGWFGVVFGDAGWETELFPSVWSLWKYHSDATQVVVDVPVGLPSDGRRRCDVAASERLESRRGVLYAPVRRAVYQETFPEAAAVNEREAGFGVQRRAWSAVPHIREVDELLDMYPSARDRVAETRPAVCFQAMDDGAGPPDADRRRELLAAAHPDAAAVYDEAVERYTTPAHAPALGSADVVANALVAAVTAERTPDRCLTLPAAPPTDERGLPMRIVYPSDTEQVRLSALEDR